MIVDFRVNVGRPGSGVGQGRHVSFDTPICFIVLFVLSAAHLFLCHVFS